MKYSTEKEAFAVTDSNTREPKRRGKFNSTRRRIQSAAVASLIAGCGADTSFSEQTGIPTGLEQNTAMLTISELNPPDAPIVLPLSNGVAARISQKEGGTFSHFRNTTQHAVDMSVGGMAQTPLAGTVHFSSGNCVAGNAQCRENNGCNGGWGNVVELDGVDGNTYIFGHCFSFQPGLNDGDFVGQGTPVCQIGCSGNATGVHLHFDRVTRSGASYVSQGIPNYLIYTAGNAGATLETPSSFSTCCNDEECDARPGTPDCKTYASLNHNTLDSLSTFARSLLANQRVASVNGGFRLYQDYRAEDYSLYTQDADVMINGARTRTQIAFQVGDFFGTGSRNPLIVTANSYFFNPQTNQWQSLMQHSDIKSENFINFDLWDYARANLVGANQGTIQMPQNVNHNPNWSPDWELHWAQFNVNGTVINPYLAVSKAIRGMRVATHFENNRWKPWTAL